MIGSVSPNVVFRLPGASHALVRKDEERNPLHPSAREETIDRLQKRDAHVRKHEAIHMNSFGVLSIGGPRYTYQIGPDGKAYAVGGEVTLASLPASDAQSAERAAGYLKRAARGVDDPSPQDLAAASAADAMAAEARNSIAEYKKSGELYASSSPLSREEGNSVDRYA